MDFLNKKINESLASIEESDLLKCGIHSVALIREKGFEPSLVVKHLEGPSETYKGEKPIFEFLGKFPNKYNTK